MKNKFSSLFLTLLLLVSGCGQKYFIMNDIDLRKAENRGPKCVGMSYGNYQEADKKKTWNSLKECESSKELKLKRDKFKRSYSFKIYRKFRNSPKFSEVACDTVAGKSSYYEYEAYSDKLFDTHKDCYTSKDFKAAQKNFKRKSAITSRKREKERRKKIHDYVAVDPEAVPYLQTALDRKIKIGMPEVMLYHSIGYPQKSNKSVGSWGTHEQLIYKNRYIYIKNGKVSSWQSK